MLTRANDCAAAGPFSWSLKRYLNHSKMEGNISWQGTKAGGTLELDLNGKRSNQSRVWMRTGVCHDFSLLRASFPKRVMG